MDSKSCYRIHVTNSKKYDKILTVNKEILEVKVNKLYSYEVTVTFKDKTTHRYLIEKIKTRNMQILINIVAEKYNLYSISKTNFKFL